MVVNDKKLNEFVERAGNEWGVSMGALLIFVGDRLGLFKAMVGAGALTPEELAKKTGTHPRMIREWLASQASEFDGRPMVASGSYRMILTYFVPEEPTSSENFSEEVEFVFDYSHFERQQPSQTIENNNINNNEPATATADTSANTIRRTINVTAMNMMVTQGLDYVQNLNSMITTTQPNIPNSENMFRVLEAIQRTLQNIQGNLTGVTPLARAGY